MKKLSAQKLKEIYDLHNKFVKESPIKLAKLINTGLWQNTYEHKVVYGIEDSIKWCQEGWIWEDLNARSWYYENVTIFTWRAVNRLLAELQRI